MISVVTNSITLKRKIIFIGYKNPNLIEVAQILYHFGEQFLITSLWKCSTQYASKFGKLSSGHRTEKGAFIPIPKKSNAKECSNYCTIALISHASKVMLKILQARLQQFVNCELPYVQLHIRKGRGTRDQITNMPWIIKKAREFQKNIYFWVIDYSKAPDCVDHNKLWKILKEMGIPDHLTCLLRNLYADQEATVRTGRGQQTGSKSGKE